MAAAPTTSPFGQGARPTLPAAVQGSTNLRATGSAANTTCAVTMDAVTGTPVIICQVIWSYSGAPTGGRVTIECGSDVLFDVDVIAGGPAGYTFTPPLALYAGSSAVVKAHPAAGVTGKVNVNAYVLA